MKDSGKTKTQLISELEALRKELAQSREADRSAGLNHLVWQIFQTLPFSISMKDQDGRFIFVNRAFSEMHGVEDPAWFNGRLPTETPQISLDGGAYIEQLDAKVVKSGQPAEWDDYRVFLPDGEQRTLDMYKFPLRNDQGAVDRILTWCQDISERKRIEANLKAGESQLQAVFDTLPHIVAIKDTEGRYVRVNRAMSETFGLEPEDYEGLLPRELPVRPAENNQDAEHEDQKVLSGERDLVETEYRRIDRHGEEITFLGIRAPLKDEAGTIIGMVAVSLDITERKKAEEKLRNSEEKYRNLIEGSAQGLIIHTDRPLFANEAAADIFGYQSPEEILELDKIDLIFAPNERSIIAERRKARLGGEDVLNQYVARMIRKDGKLIWVDTFVRIVKWEGEDAIQCTYIDITERKKAEENLRESQDRLNDAIESIPDGFALFDADDRLVLANRRYKEVYPRHADVLVPGSRFEDMLREGVYRGDFADAIGREEEWIAERLRTHANPPGPIEQRLSDGRWLRTEEKHTREGGIVGLGTDITEIKKATEALRESEERFRDFAESSADWFWEMDADLRFTFMSPNVERILGVPPEWHYGKTREDLLGEEFDRELWEVHFHDMREQRPFRDFVYLRTGEGIQPKWLSSSGIPVHDADRNFHGYRGVGSDVTERMRIETELRDNQLLLRTVFDSISHWIIVKDRESRYIMVNQAFAESYERNPGDFRGKLTEEIPTGTETEIERFLETDRKVVESGRAWDFGDYPAHLPDGTRRVSRMYKSPLRDEEGHVVGLVGVAEDVTEQRKMEETLRENERLLQTMLDSIPHWVYVKDQESRYLLVNKAMASAFNRMPEDFAGVSTKGFRLSSEPRFGTEEELEKLVAMDRQVIETGNPVEAADFRLTSPKGEKRYHHIIKLPLRDSKGSNIGVVGVSENITMRKAMEEQLRQSQKMDAVGQLAGGVAHDFNNMLQIIHGYAELSMRDANLSSDTQGFLSQVKKASERAASLTRQLLAFSRQQILAKKVFDLNHLIGDQMKMLRRVIGEEIELVIHARAPLLPVLADPGMIEQVLMNLCINARDAMPDGGRLLIETSGMVATPEFVAQNAWAHEGSYAVILVNDDGTGMPPKVREKIFEPFFTTKEQGKGTGLGLSMVYGILQQHEGMITVYSEPGQGTTFTVYLPRVEESVRDADEEAQAESAGGSETILIAEDEPEVLNLAVTLLEEKGYTILTAANGEEAIEVFNRQGNGIDLILLDLVMPKLGGHQVMEILRKTKPFLPVLLTTGYSPGRFEIGGFSENRVKMIQKPYDPSELFQLVRELIDGE